MQRLWLIQYRSKLADKWAVLHVLQVLHVFEHVNNLTKLLHWKQKPPLTAPAALHSFIKSLIIASWRWFYPQDDLWVRNLSGLDPYEVGIIVHWWLGLSYPWMGMWSWRVKLSHLWLEMGEIVAEGCLNWDSVRKKRTTLQYARCAACCSMYTNKWIVCSYSNWPRAFWFWFHMSLICIVYCPCPPYGASVASIKLWMSRDSLQRFRLNLGLCDVMSRMSH